MKLTAHSFHRFRAGAAAKRAYGSATATVFGIINDEGKTLFVEAYGPTPGDRKTAAIKAAEPYFSGEKTWPEGNSENMKTVKAYVRIV